MGRLVTEQEIKQLEANPNVEHASQKSIMYTPMFKVAAIMSYQEGQTPMEIFVRADFNIDVIGRKTPKRSLERRRTVYATYSEPGLLEERRGKGSTGRRSTSELTVSMHIKKDDS